MLRIMEFAQDTATERERERETVQAFRSSGFFVERANGYVPVKLARHYYRNAKRVNYFLIRNSHELIAP